MRDVISRKTGPDVDCIPNDAFTIAIAICSRWMGLQLPYELDNISVPSCATPQGSPSLKKLPRIRDLVIYHPTANQVISITMMLVTRSVIQKRSPQLNPILFPVLPLSCTKTLDHPERKKSVERPTAGWDNPLQMPKEERSSLMKRRNYAVVIHFRVLHFPAELFCSNRESGNRARGPVIRMPVNDEGQLMTVLKEKNILLKESGHGLEIASKSSDKRSVNKSIILESLNRVSFLVIWRLTNMSNIYIQGPPTMPKVAMKTTVGDIELELRAKETQKTCRNFIQLCVEGYYHDPKFHIKGGDPTGTGEGGRIYGELFNDDFRTRLRSCGQGLIAMANAGEDDNSSQFFFTLGSTLELQNKHTIFCKVTGETIYNMLQLEEALVDEVNLTFTRK
ncbi:Peptidyl-prolyl cis-trans isomerase CWC27 like protein [Eufriesea mexicana]|uniref:Spliceosome-associated protein CWC27 homolog n=1 Tax=Eufriesea mexicana TaxID=516756 RepID=A0A310SPG2_9HYME|nr:Peptidyl-prolyl cis-trans isomerase CWC27 like protein [Eufriesea mexicana]